jgi:hypothetical protein
MAMDIGETEIPAGVPISELLVIKAHQVEDCGLKVVNMHRVFHSLKPEIVGGPMDCAASDAPSTEDK